MIFLLDLCWCGNYIWSKTCSRMHKNVLFRRRTCQNFSGEGGQPIPRPNPFGAAPSAPLFECLLHSTPSRPYFWIGAWTVLTIALMLQCCTVASVCRLSVVCNVMYCGYTLHPSAKVTIDSLWEVVYEKLIGSWYQIEWPWPLFRDRIKVMSTIVSHSPLNISETVRDRGLVPKDHQ